MPLHYRFILRLCYSMPTVVFRVLAPPLPISVLTSFHLSARPVTYSRISSLSRCQEGIVPHTAHPPMVCFLVSRHRDNNIALSDLVHLFPVLYFTTARHSKEVDYADRESNPACTVVYCMILYPVCIPYCTKTLSVYLFRHTIFLSLRLPHLTLLSFLPTHTSYKNIQRLSLVDMCL